MFSKCHCSSHIDFGRHVKVRFFWFTFNSNSIAQELKNCVFGKNTLDFVIDKTKNIVSQLNKEKGTEQIYNIKEIKNNMIISEVSLFDGKDNEGIELNLDFNLFSNKIQS